MNALNNKMLMEKKKKKTKRKRRRKNYTEDHNIFNTSSFTKAHTGREHIEYCGSVLRTRQ